MKIEININTEDYEAIDAYVRKEFGKSLKQLIKQEVDELVKNAAEQTVLRQEIAMDIKAIRNIGLLKRRMIKIQ